MTPDTPDTPTTTPDAPDDPDRRRRRGITLPDGTRLDTTAAYAHLAESPDWDGRCCSTTRSGRRCGQPAMHGQVVCRMHGGKSPQALRRAQLRVAVREARSELGRLGIPIPDTDPVDALQAAVDAAAGRLVASAALLATADPDDARLDAYAELHRQAVETLARVGKAAADTGIAERRTQLAEAQGAAVATAIRAIVDRLGLTPEQRAAFPGIAREVLGQLAAGGDGDGDGDGDEDIVDADIVEDGDAL